MGFKDKYTTEYLKVKERSDLKIKDDKDFDNLLRINKDLKLEKDKIVLSNDFYAQGELIELLINTMRNR